MTTALVIMALLAACSQVLTRGLRDWSGPVLAAAVAGVGGWLLWIGQPVWSGTPVSESFEWVPGLGFDFSLWLDGLSLLFCILICFIGAAVLLYASSYLRGHRKLGLFYATLIAFMTSMLSLVLSDNLILVFVSWELTSITSFLLIGFDHEREAARKSALQALLVTGVGGLCLLAGVLILGIGAGTFTISQILATPSHDLPGYAPAAILILIGACTKSAAYPFHFWLPNAMEAPSPVSALLHSSTMVKAGVYLAARMHPTMGGTALWDNTLIFAGGVTMLLAAFAAVHQTQLKKILAYSTVSSLGTLLMLIGLDAPKAMAMYLLGHAFYKGCLFLIAGSVAHATHQKYAEKLSGVGRVMPVTMVVALVAGLSMAGFFPFLGFVGKELLLKATLYDPRYGLLLTTAATLAAVMTVVAAAVVSFKPFFGRPKEGEELHPDAHESDWRQLLGPVVLAVAGAITGLLPFLISTPIAKAVVRAMDPSHAAEPLKLDALSLLWPPTTATYLSLGAVAGGVVLYVFRGQFRRMTSFATAPVATWPERLYEASLWLLDLVARVHIKIMSGVTLRHHIRLTLVVTSALVLTALYRSNERHELILGDMSALSVLLTLLILGVSAGLPFLRSAMGMVAVIGVVGFALAVMYARLGAPDVAMTQLAVETLVVVVFVLAILHMPSNKGDRKSPSRFLDGVVAIVFGLAMGAIALLAIERPTPDSVSAYFAEKSYTEGFGRNVVNVILVDFRSLDTLGEITVLAVAAIGVATLIRIAPRRRPRDTGGRS